ncbi:hypothetical protein ACO0LM_12360 [Undibacterium sp. Di26W]|uniref:hypothetical protein n=1 Tax=Undibacterium sp. Di26W TaxID=3413035 RepID=UPI003BF30362
MKFHTGISFTSGLPLEELGNVIQLHDATYDYENEDEWIIGTCEGVDKIDICRTHLVSPIETKTTVLRYDFGEGSVIPSAALIQIVNRLTNIGVANIEVNGFDQWGKFLTQSFDEEFDP